jgi:P27 family predicted phage terminase small subunit
MGRKPKHPDFRLIEGNREKRPINTNVPRPEPVRPPCSKILDRIARRYWLYIVRELEAMGTLAHSDQGIIAAAANAYSRWHRAEEQLKALAKGPDQYTEVMKTKSGNWIQNPLVGIANAARDALVRYGSELGLSPTARAKINIDTPQPATRRERLLS